MLEEAVKVVQEFNKRISFVEQGDRLTRPYHAQWYETHADITLNSIADMLNEVGGMFNDLFKHQQKHKLSPDPRLYTAHLIVSEVAETLKGLAEKNETATLDGLCDTLVCILHTALIFDLPINEGFKEVMRSNLTKDGSVGYEKRFKGPEYSPPNLKGVLSSARL